MKIDWAPSDSPLPAVAVACAGAAAQRIEAKVDRNPQWRVTRFDHWIVVVGDDLPWVEGATYLGALPGAPLVLVPVHRRPRLHPQLVSRAAAAFRGSARAAALIPSSDGVTVLPLVLP